MLPIYYLSRDLYKNLTFILDVMLRKKSRRENKTEEVVDMPVEAMILLETKICKV